MKNRLLSLFLVLVMMLMLAPAAVAEDTVTDQYRITDEPVTLKLIRSDNSNQPMQLGNDVLKAIEEYTGVTLEIEAVAGSDFMTKTEMVIATGADYDIMYDCYYVSNYAGQGAFLDVNQYMDVMPNISALFEQYPDMYKLYIDGALYQIPVMGRFVNRFGRSPQIRADLLAETGLPTPTTYTELFDVLKAIKANHPDTYPIGNRNGTNNLMICYSYSFGTGYESNGVYWEPSENQYKFGPMSDEFMTMLQWFADAYAEGILDPDYSVTTSTKWQENMSSGYSSFFYDNPTFASNYNLVLEATDENAYFEPLPVPFSGDVQRGLYYNKHDMGATVINADTEYPEIACKLMDFLYSDFGATLVNFGIEGVTYEFDADGNPVILDAAIEDYTTASDPMRAFFGEYSLGKLGMARYIDEHNQDKFMTPALAEWYDIWAGWDFMEEPVMNPSFTSDESEELSELLTEVTDILAMSYDAFIMGQRPVSEWTQVQDQISDNVDRILEIYNTAATR
jgi:putative aldouronate transport system substrate-binding protein